MMPVYDAERFSPPAPVAKVELRTRDQAKAAFDVPMLIDSGADLTLIPQRCVQELGLRDEPLDGYLQGFDGSTSPARVINIEVHFLQYIFRGLFLVTDDECGILGRNVLNRLSLVLDGPALQWRDETGNG
jgi:hypothetical protein